MSYNYDWYLGLSEVKLKEAKGGENLEVSQYIDLLRDIVAEIKTREWALDIDPTTFAVAILAELSKDGRMAQIKESRAEERQEQKTREPTPKQLAFIAKHCGEGNFKGTFEQANAMIDAKMREKGWGKYSK